MRSPDFTSRGTTVPSSSLFPVPTAITSPSCDFSFAVSGMMIPPLAVSCSSTRFIKTRSCKGLSDIKSDLLFLMAAPYCLGFRATALTLRAGLHSQPLICAVGVIAWIAPHHYEEGRKTPLCTSAQRRRFLLWYDPGALREVSVRG